MAGQAQQTDITRRLAAWAAILAVPTAVAGIYGMNFKNMPELEWAYGYFGVVAVILGTCTALYWRFRKAHWLWPRVRVAPRWATSIEEAR